jgi:hypothetical protein
MFGDGGLMQLHVIIPATSCGKVAFAAHGNLLLHWSPNEETMW